MIPLMDRPSRAAAGPVDLAEARLRWLDRRQEVLARNIANADTPSFRARDVTPFADHLLRAGAGGTALARTDPRHLAGGAGAARDRPDAPSEITPDGNAVSLDEQAIKVADTDSAHALAMGLHRRWTGLFRTALGRNG